MKAVSLADIKPEEQKREWTAGKDRLWRHNEEMQELELWFDVERIYWIDLESITCSAAMLDWIFQICGKAWATPTIAKSLLEAFRHLFEPQQYLCSWQREQEDFNYLVVMEKVKQNREEALKEWKNERASRNRRS